MKIASLAHFFPANWLFFFFPLFFFVSFKFLFNFAFLSDPQITVFRWFGRRDGREIHTGQIGFSPLCSFMNLMNSLVRDLSFLIYMYTFYFLSFVMIYLPAFAYVNMFFLYYIASLVISFIRRLTFTLFYWTCNFKFFSYHIYTVMSGYIPVILFLYLSSFKISAHQNN